MPTPKKAARRRYSAGARAAKGKTTSTRAKPTGNRETRYL